MATVRRPLAVAGRPRGAGTQELLAAWSGLGYNRRALALRDAARTIVAEHGGRVPSTIDALEALPGIGPYTARAVAAAAFGVPVAPLDVNVRRVVSRVLGVPASSPGLQAAADELVSREEPGRWFDAVMDLASGVCLPRAPSCDACPLAVRVRVARGGRGRRGAVDAERALPVHDRWLRGRLVAAAAGVPDGGWVALPDRLGVHDRRRSWRPRAVSNGKGSWTSRTARSAFDSDAARGRPFRHADGGVGYASWAMPAPARPATPDAAPPLPADDPSIFEMDLRALRHHWAASAALPPISAETMTGADRRAQALGIPEVRLMEHAGTAVAAAVKALATDLERWGTGPIVILCGPGNNGGDGYVAARRLALAGASVIVAVVAAEARPRGASAARNWDRIARDAGITKVQLPVARDVAMFGLGVDKAAVIVDALLGTGVRGALREPIRSAVEVIGRARAAGVPVVAVDTPDRGRPVERRAVRPGGRRPT